MTFDAYDRSLELLRALTPVIAKLATHDPELTKQLRRAAASTSLNLAEGNRRAGKDRRYLFSVALGSAAEVGGCLDVALAFAYVAAAEVAESIELADRIRAMTYRLAR